MHQALQIPEILLNIFNYVFRPPSYRGPWPMSEYNSDMAALARTCRAFQGPALDILWSILRDMSPLARCLPDASCQGSHYSRTHKLSRALTQDEWDILRSYTRRIRTIMYFDLGFDWESVLPRTVRENIVHDTLFPNLRFLACRFSEGTMCSPPHQHTPSLTSIDITADTTDGPRLVQNYLKPFSELYPSLRKITLHRHPVTILDDNDDLDVFTWPWKDLQVLNCPGFTLNADDLTHLSRLPELTEVNFTLSETLAHDIIANLSSPLTFPSLRRLGFSRDSGHLNSISKLLSKMELPAIEHLDVDGIDNPSESVSSFLATLQKACVNRSLVHLQLDQGTDYDTANHWTSEPVLTPNDLRPAMVFSNIRHLDLEVAGYVALADAALLELASAWPQLEFFSINEESGWNRPKRMFGGITPGGLLQLLLKCPSLNYIALAIDTRGYTTASDSEALDWLSITNSTSSLPTTFYIDVLDSIIEEESISAISTCLASIVRPYSKFDFHAWKASSCELYPDNARDAYLDRWDDVYQGINAILGRSTDDRNSYWRESLKGTSTY